ncbi:MAG: diaminopimelate decarboxylase, partial [Bacteroidales bacterium]|nr:diaminopimelate decarboxylase [Bacteroidales bacterium]
MFDVNRIEFFEQVETPFYFYDMDLLRSTVEKVAALSAEYGITVHYAVKANVERRILEYISSMGFGADCVSGNEVMHACSCRFPAEKIVFAGVGKSDREIAEAIKAGVGMFNCESLQEIFVVNAMAGRFGKRVNVSIRVNPGVDAHTHRYITTGTYENKFGISDHEFSATVEMIKRCGNIDFAGLHFHIGSQITDVEEVFALECPRANEIVDRNERQGLKEDKVNLGRTLRVDYED